MLRTAPYWAAVALTALFTGQQAQNLSMSADYLAAAKRVKPKQQMAIVFPPDTLFIQLAPSGAGASQVSQSFSPIVTPTHSCLLAEQLSVRTIAFPSISTGIYGYPILQAAQVAVQTVAAHKSSSIEQVLFCCFSQQDLEVYQHALSRLAA